MATRLKTVEFAHPPLAALTDNTLTSMTQITVYLPETGTKTFRSVIATVSAVGTATATGNVTTRQLQCRLGAAAYTSNTNSNLHTGSGEDIIVFHSVNLTSHFQTNWTGTSMTFDSQVLLDGTATGIAWTNVCVTLQVTYEYDDTSTTQIKTVRIPLNAPVGAFATTKPGTATATIPNLSTELPEASKVFRSTHIVVQGNTSINAATTDATITMQLDATTAHTTGIFEGVSASDLWYRYVWDCAAVLNTSASMGFYIWGSVARFNHSQAYLVVTYEFNASTTTQIFNSLMLPMDMSSPMGGTTSADYQRGARDFFIQEPGTITTKQIAFYSFWEQAAAISGLNMRVGTGSFVTYTNTALNVGGSIGAMTRNDAAFTLARGRNNINFDIYRTDTADFGWGLCGFWIINYTSDVPTQGIGAANHTVMWNLGSSFDGAAASTRTYTATAPIIPEVDHYITAVGNQLRYVSNTTSAVAGLSLSFEKTAAEGNVAWINAYADPVHTDPETGLRHVYTQVKDYFERWTGDPQPDRLLLETSRRWRTAYGNGATAFEQLDMMITYHSITYTISGNITGSAGGTVEISVDRDSTGEEVLTTSRVGDGAYSLTWYDNTENLYVSAYENSTHVGRSDRGVP
jgi:hypothetical protein